MHLILPVSSYLHCICLTHVHFVQDEDLRPPSQHQVKFGITARKWYICSQVKELQHCFTIFLTHQSLLAIGIRTTTSAKQLHDHNGACAVQLQYWRMRRHSCTCTSACVCTRSRCPMLSTNTTTHLPLISRILETRTPKINHHDHFYTKQ